MDTQIKVLIIDDHAISGLGTKALLMSYADISIVEIARSSAEALQYLYRNDVDVVLLDLFMPDVDGFEVLKSLKLHYQHIKVIILTISDEKENILRAINLDADGYIFKDTTQDELSNGIRKAYKNQPAFNLRAFETVFSELKKCVKQNNEIETKKNEKLDKNKIISLITNRELEVLKMIGEKKSSSEIADFFGISKFTVNTYRKNLYSKLKLNNMKELLVAARIAAKD